MLVGTKAKIMMECEKRNRIRRVCNGRVDHQTFFQNIHGDLLISGYGAASSLLLADMVCGYMRRGDMPTIVLSDRTELFHLLRQRQRAGEITRMMISDPADRNYHPFYGMSTQYLLRFIRMTGEELGFGILIDKMMQYAAAALNVVNASYPVSLPALVNLLQYDDNYIASHAVQVGLGRSVADTIRANQEAGNALRQTCETLEHIFEDVYTRGSDTKYNFQSGVLGDIAVMGFHIASSNQKTMNCYLKEELFCTLKRIQKIRVVVDEVPFDSQDDELLNYLFQMKRQQKIELVFVSRNASEVCSHTQTVFPNVLLFLHNSSVSTEALSDMLWGKYPHHYPVPVAAAPPAVVFTLKKALHWQIATEERLRVRAEDLYARPGFFTKSSDLLAVKSTANDIIYLVSSAVFLPEAEGSDFQ